MSKPTTAPAFFNAESLKPWPFRVNVNSDEQCWGSLQKSSEWRSYVTQDQPDPGWCQYVFNIVPKLKSFVLGYNGFQALRHLLQNIANGLSTSFNAKHFGHLGAHMAFSPPYREQTVRLEIMLVGQHEQDQHPVEEGDFITTMFKRGNDEVLVPAKVKGLHMGIIDGTHWLELEPYLLETVFPSSVLPIVALPRFYVKLHNYTLVIKREDVVGRCNIFEDMDELLKLTKQNPCSLFFACRYEYVGAWHPVWLPNRQWTLVQFDDQDTPSAQYLKEIVCDDGGEAKSWASGLQPVNYMDLWAMMSQGAPALANKFYQRMARSRPKKAAMIELCPFSKEMFFAVVLRHFHPRQATVESVFGRQIIRFEVPVSQFDILREHVFKPGGFPGFPKQVVGRPSHPGDTRFDQLEVNSTILFEYNECLGSGGRLKCFFNYQDLNHPEESNTAADPSTDPLHTRRGAAGIEQVPKRLLPVLRKRSATSAQLSMAEELPEAESRGERAARQMAQREARHLRRTGLRQVAIPDAVDQYDVLRPQHRSRGEVDLVQVVQQQKQEQEQQQLLMAEEEQQAQEAQQGQQGHRAQQAQQQAQQVLQQARQQVQHVEEEVLQVQQTAVPAPPPPPELSRRQQRQHMLQVLSAKLAEGLREDMSDDDVV